MKCLNNCKWNVQTEKLDGGKYCKCKIEAKIAQVTSIWKQESIYNRNCETTLIRNTPAIVLIFNFVFFKFCLFFNFFNLKYFYFLICF